MGLTFTSYVIYGWDITEYVNREKFDQWKWQKSNSKYFNYQFPRHVQIWETGNGGTYHIIFGYCIWAANKYDYTGPVFFSEKDKEDIESKGGDQFLQIASLFKKMLEEGIIESIPDIDPQIICFADNR